MEYLRFKVALSDKKSRLSVDTLPEVFTSTKATSSAIAKAVHAGRLRKIASRLYTKNKSEAPEKVVRRNWHSLLKDYFPDAIISDRTALENRPAADGSVFIISAGTRAVALPGIIFRPRTGSPPLESDRLFLGGVRLCSSARAWLENMRRSRARSGAAARTLSKTELEERLDSLLRQGGEQALNTLRDQARSIALELRMETEFHLLDELIGGFLGTREAKFITPLARFRKKGSPYDPDRFQLFLALSEELRLRAPIIRPAGQIIDSARTHLAFFEAYFSNYIEGTEFGVEEAVDIIFNGVIPTDRPEDAHDVLATYRIVFDEQEMRRTPRDFADFRSLLKRRHRAFMELRPETKPGEFKAKDNRAGNTFFVAPDLVEGTLEKGFEIYRTIDPPLHRAIFMMFLVSEVHPFADGNGRAARIMMNAELVAAGEHKIIIPTIYRNHYLTALKAFSQGGKCAPLIRTLDFAQRYARSIRWEGFESARADLQATNAFLDANEAEDKGVRLFLPRDAD